MSKAQLNLRQYDIMKPCLKALLYWLTKNQYTNAKKFAGLCAAVSLFWLSREPQADWQITAIYIFIGCALIIWVFDLPFQITTTGLIRQEVSKQLEEKEKAFLRHLATIGVEGIYTSAHRESCMERINDFITKSKTEMKKIGFTDEEITKIEFEDWSFWRAWLGCETLRRKIETFIRTNYIESSKKIQHPAQFDLKQLQTDIQKLIENFPEALKADISAEVPQNDYKHPVSQNNGSWFTSTYPELVKKKFREDDNIIHSHTTTIKQKHQGLCQYSKLKALVDYYHCSPEILAELENLKPILWH